MKALGPAPERMTARVEGEVERNEKRGGSSAHILSHDRLARGQVAEKRDRVYSRVCEGIELLWAVDLYMSNEWKWIGEIEVLADRWAISCCHDEDRLALTQ